MKNFKCLPVFLMVILFVYSGHAQQQYFSRHYGGPGTQYLYNSLYHFGPDSVLTQSGPDQIWDLTGSSELQTHLSKIVSKDNAFDFFTFVTICGFGDNSSLDCINIWGNTDQAWQVEDTVSLFEYQLTGLQRFQKRTTANLFENFLGFTTDLGGSPTKAVVVYSNPDTLLHFPVTYGDDYTSSIRWSIDLNPVGQNIRYQSHQTRTTSIDAWGDLITPLQTFDNVVRMKSIVHREDTLTTDSTTLPINLTQVEYMWYDSAYKLPVMIVNGTMNDSTEHLGAVRYLWDKTCAAPTWEASIENVSYETDSTGAVTIDFTITNGNADTYYWEWDDGQSSTTTGSTTHTYTEPGFYSVGLTACMTNCLPLNSCSYAILDFEVVTAVNTIPGDQVGIKLYPNPVGDEIHMVLPEVIGAATFSISDLNGKEVRKGIVHTGVNTLSSLSLPNGLYAMLIHPEAKRLDKQYVMRFLVNQPKN